MYKNICVLNLREEIDFADKYVGKKGKLIARNNQFVIVNQYFNSDLNAMKT